MFRNPSVPEPERKDTETPSRTLPRNVTCGFLSYYFRATQMAPTGLVPRPFHCYFADSDADPPLR